VLVYTWCRGIYEAQEIQLTGCHRRIMKFEKMQWGLRILFAVVGMACLVYSSIEFAAINAASTLPQGTPYEVNFLRLAGIIGIGAFFLLAGVSGRLSLWWLKK